MTKDFVFVDGKSDSAMYEKLFAMMKSQDSSFLRINTKSTVLPKPEIQKLLVHEKSETSQERIAKN